MSVSRGVRAASAALVIVALTGCWPAEGYGPDRTGHNPLEDELTIANVASLEVEWEAAPVAGPVFGVVTNGSVVVSNNGAYMRGYSARTGEERWSIGPSYRSIPFLHPLIDDDLVYVPSQVVTVSTSAVDLRTGAAVAPQIGGKVSAVRGSERLVSKAVPKPDYSGGTYSFQVEDPSDPGASWGGVTHVQQGIAADESPRLTLGEGVVFSTGHGLLATAPGDGTSGVGVRSFPAGGPATCGAVDNPVYACPGWVAALPGTQATPAVIGSGGDRLYVATDAGTVHAVDAATGAIDWTADLGAPIVDPPALAEGSLFVPVSTGGVAVLPADGCGAAECGPGWTATTGTAVAAQPSVAGGVVYVATQGGSLQAFAAAGCDATVCDPVWSADLGSAVRTSVVSNGRVIVGTQGGRLVSFSPTEVAAG